MTVPCVEHGPCRDITRPTHAPHGRASLCGRARWALRDFIERSRDAEVAVVYYASHGIEVDGVNYLVPIDAALERDTDIYDEALSLDRVLIAIEPATKLRLVVLDACRDSQDEH
ncbi:caspase family protein [Bradyrhizobium sp. 191]|nr:caspase family protein [Bradyrhizobium sp. 191]